jgi:hypothetical protein
MKHLFPIALMFSLFTTAVHAEPIKVRFQTRDKKIHIGTVTEREAGSIVFLQDGATAPVQVPDAQIGFIQLPVKDRDIEKIERLMAGGKYGPAVAQLDEMLMPFIDYISLPSNLTPEFLRWMIASYWVGNEDRVLMLAEVFEGFKGSEFEKKARLYGGLVRLEQGDSQAMEAFLKRPEAETIYPPNSAARLYIDARIFQSRKKYIQAVRTAALLMALHSHDADWMPKAELLCAELYFQMDMPESAQAVLADIRKFYDDPNIQKKAAEIAAQNGMENK